MKKLNTLWPAKIALHLSGSALMLQHRHHSRWLAVRRARVEDHDDLLPLLERGRALCPELARLPQVLAWFTAELCRRTGVKSHVILGSVGCLRVSTACHVRYGALAFVHQEC